MSHLASLQILPYRAGQQVIGNLSTSQAVTFSTAMPNTNYAVTLTFYSVVATAISIYISNKTTSGFTINLGAGIAGSTTVDYVAWINN